MSWGFSVLKDMNYKYFKLCHWKRFPLHFSSWEGKLEQAGTMHLLKGQHLCQQTGREALTLGFLALHSAPYPTRRDDLSPNYQPLGQHPVTTAGWGLLGVCLPLSAFQFTGT